MKGFGLLSAIAMIGAGVYGQAVKDPARLNPVRVSSRAQVIASLEEARPKLGEPIILHYRFKNVSSQPLAVVSSEVNTDYWVMVTDAPGTELSLTKEGSRLREPPMVSNTIRGSLGPGADLGEHSFDLRKLYQLDRPGDFFVRIARRMGTDPNDPRLPSQDRKVLAQIPIEEAVSDLIPLTIVP